MRYDKAVSAFVELAASRHNALHQSEAAEIINPRRLREVGHIQTLNRAATLCSLGPHVDTTTLERCVDDFLRTNSRRWLTQTMERLGSRKPGGVNALRQIFDDPKRIDGVPDSWFERARAELLGVQLLAA